MCIACTEFIKETLTLKEYQSALREITRDDNDENEQHLQSIERLLRASAGDEGRMRDLLKQGPGSARK